MSRGIRLRQVSISIPNKADGAILEVAAIDGRNGPAPITAHRADRPRRGAS